MAAVAAATSIVWGDQVYLLQGQSVFTKSQTEVFTRKARGAPPTTMALGEMGFVLGLNSGKVEVWDRERKEKTLYGFEVEASRVNSLATRGTSILCGGGQLSFMDTRSKENPRTFWDHGEAVQSVAFGSEFFFSSGSASKLCFWDERKLVPLETFDLGVSHHHWHGSKMISTGSDQVVRLWENQKQTRRLELPATAVYLTAKKEVAIGGGTLYLNAEAQKLDEISLHSAIHPGHTELVTQGSSGKLQFFNLA